MPSYPSALRRLIADDATRLIASISTLRAATIALRAVFILVLAIWLGPVELGVYGLVAAAITLTTGLYGIDFHAYTLREISQKELSDVAHRVRDQFALISVVYLFGSITLYLLHPLLRVSSDVAMVVILLAIGQHAALEFYRILLRLERTLTATILLFLRDAAWVPACAGLYFLGWEITLMPVLLCWLGGTVIAFTYGVASLRRILPIGHSAPIDTKWLIRGIGVGLRMLLATMVIRILFSVDRFFMGSQVSAEALGAYVFFASACGAVHALIETAIMPHFWPAMLEASKTGDLEARKRAQRRMAIASSVSAAAGGLISLAATYIATRLIGNSSYTDELWMLPFLAAAYSALILVNIPHYILYARGRDNAIVASSLIALAIFAVCVLLGQVQVPLALLIACASMLVTKSLFVRLG